MTPRLPPPASEVFDRAVLCHVAVRTAHGPHVTPMVFVLDGGKLWVTTARSSVKARAWRRGPEVAGVVEHEGVGVAFRGVVRTYDALDPLTWPAAAVGGPGIARAAVRFSVKNARFFAGYAVDASRVPFAWTPPGRVFARIVPEAGRVLRLASPGGRRVLGGWGAWPEGVRFRRSFASGSGVSALDRRVPREVRAAVGTAGRGALAVDGQQGLVVLPAWWRRVGEGYDVLIPRDVLELSGASASAPAALAASRLAVWRVAEMRGMLLQGRAEMYAATETTRGAAALRRRLEPGPEVPSEETALVRLRPRRIVWWTGWAGGAVIASRGSTR